jgi:hypothetical protein
MLLVVYLDDTPGVPTSTDLTAICGADFGVGTDNGERHLRHDFGILCDRLLVIELVARSLEDLDLVVFNVRENLPFISWCLR